MLILSRRESESVHLGDDIILTIVRVSGEKVRIGIQAPPHIKVLRNELEIENGGALKPQAASRKPALEKTALEKTALEKADPNTRSTPIQVRRAA